MAYVLKIWTFNERDGWKASFDPLPETLDDARSLANWWIIHRPSDAQAMEVHILQRGEVVELLRAQDLREGRLHEG